MQKAIGFILVIGGCVFAGAGFAAVEIVGVPPLYALAGGALALVIGAVMFALANSSSRY